MSLSYLRAGETDLGGILLQQFVAKWGKVTETLSENPPAPFAKDPEFGASLAEILNAAKDAQASLDRGDVKTAVATLTPVRGILADVRRRNGLRTLSDCIDDISGKMDVLWKLRQSKFDSHDPSQARQASDAVSALGPILDRCGQQPPTQNREQFERLIHQASSSVNDARQALAAQDTDRFIRIVRELRSIDHILFQQFD